MEGIENLKKMVSVAVELGDVAIEIKDSANTIDRIKAAIGLVDEFTFLIGLDYDALRKEWNDLSGNEHAELVQHFAAEFDIENDRVEGLVEKSFEAVLHVVRSVEQLISLTKSYA